MNEPQPDREFDTVEVLNAGLELDKKVHSGMYPDHRVSGGCYYIPNSSIRIPIPYYSQDVDAAFRVVTFMADQGRVVVVTADGLREKGNPRYSVLISDLWDRTDADTAALAICRAFLKVMEQPK